MHVILPGSAGRARPASRAYERGHVVDWSREPFARGAYTYPSLGAHINDRCVFAPSILQCTYPHLRLEEVASLAVPEWAPGSSLGP